MKGMHQKQKGDSANPSLYFIGDPSKPSQVVALRSLQLIKLRAQVYLIWVPADQNNAINFSKGIPRFNEIIVERQQRVQTKILQLQQKNPSGRFQLFCSDLQSLQRLSCALWGNVQITFYFFNYTDDGNEIEKFNKGKWNNLVQNKIMDLQDFRKKSLQQNILPNCVLLFEKKQVNKLKITLEAMTKHNSTQNTMQLIKSFKQIMVQSGQDEKEVQKVFQKYISGKQDIIQLYKRQSIFYPFFNNFLRKVQDPLILFYAQPLVSDMFHQIKQKCIRQKRLYRHQKQLIFFRGATFSQKEKQDYLNNIGKFIYPLAFTSASRKKSKAQEFMVNALITIIVPNEKRYNQTDFGFIILSQDQQEQQVIFNLLNSFRISKAQRQQNNNIKIELVYGEVSMVTQKIVEHKQLNQFQAKIETVCKYEKKISQVENQADIFISAGQLDSAQKYWSQKIKYISGKAAVQHIYFAQIQLIRILILKKDYDNAQKKINELMNQIQRNSQFKNQFPTQVIKLKKLKGETLMGLQRCDEGKKLYEQTLESALENKCNKKFMIQLYESLSYANRQTKDLDKAKKYSQKAFRLVQSQYKENEIEYEFHKLKYISINQSNLISSRINKFLPKLESIEGYQTHEYLQTLLSSIILQLQRYFPTVSQNIQSISQIESKSSKLNIIIEKLVQIQIIYLQIENTYSAHQKAQYLYMIGLIYKKLNKFQNAVLLFIQSLEYYQSYGQKYQLQCAQLHSQIGLNLFKQKNESQSEIRNEKIKHLQKSVSLFQKYKQLTQQHVATQISTLVALGKLFKQTDLNESMKYFQRMFQIKPQLRKAQNYSQLFEKIQKYNQSKSSKQSGIKIVKTVSQVSTNESNKLVRENQSFSSCSSFIKSQSHNKNIQLPIQKVIDGQKSKQVNKSEQLSLTKQINIADCIKDSTIQKNINSNVNILITREEANIKKQQTQQKQDKLQQLFQSTQIKSTMQQIHQINGQNNQSNKQSDQSDYENVFTPKWIYQHLQNKQDPIFAILKLKQCANDCIDQQQYENALQFINICQQIIKNSESIHIELVKIVNNIKQTLQNLMKDTK